MSKSKLIVGLTGGIACGKSTVAKMFQDFADVLVIDTDSVAKKIIFSPEGYEIVRLIFGSDVCVGGNVSKERLTKAIFTNQAKKKELERVVHPLVWAEVKKLATYSDKGIVFVESALIYEMYSQSRFDLVVVVACSEVEQKNRLMTRSALTAEEASQRINSQMKMAEKVKQADFTIWSDGGLSKLETSVKKVHTKLLHLKKGKGNESR
jgi:dephospho-CoA kinase